ncbi:MAG: succinate dehydrogenase, hydrophobic membrane anchor protein [Betaproteobacteria bacterium]|nr:succinate dehydrogenase, hydrophobic membrane anchor protein [Betaproteobacteria bacterium]
MTDSIGSKRLVVGAHYGLRDWLAQRITATLMALFTVLVLAQLILSRGPIGYDKWAGIFSPQWMRALTFTVILALTYHVWVGMRDIWMDYIKPVGMRLGLQIFTMVWLLSCMGWAVQVLWRL